jgi:hypothetical protein
MGEVVVLADFVALGGLSLSEVVYVSGFVVRSDHLIGPIV